ncbi:MAG: hypothetical protein JSS83_05845 [Cyanobacteria bacterium SZAS LIN-3]|nr:hypothetical protein [Cyanobacteria bacterium SZAS LIN-3]
MHFQPSVFHLILWPCLVVLLIGYCRYRKDKRSQTAETTASDLPSPADLRAEREKAREKEEQESREAFMNALASVKSSCINEIQCQYVRDHDSMVLVKLPREMWKRRDLIDREIVSWLRAQGWSATHKWGTITDDYILLISAL